MRRTLKGKSLLQKIWRRLCGYLASRAAITTERLGSGYGGWTICPAGIDTTSVVFSAGIGEDITFDNELIEKYGCQIHAFDPTPRVREWLKENKPVEKFVYYEIGFADYDGQAIFYPPENPDFVSHSLLQRKQTAGQAITVEVRRLSTLMSMTGCDHIDLLKMDIEGAEYKVISDLLMEKLYPRQILVEFHDFQPGIGLSQTIQSTFQLLRNGYRLFHLSSNGHEYSFIHNGAKK